MIFMRKVPNALSVTRIFLSLTLLFTWHLTPLYMTLYVLCGLTDILDGFIARRWGVISSTGAKLDSIGDLVFFAVIAYGLIFQSSLTIPNATWLLIVSIVCMRLVNMIITQLKFKRFSILHSVLNKTTGALLFLLLPILMVYPVMVQGFITGLIALAWVSALEEGIILIFSKAYDENPKFLTLLNLWRDKHV